MSETKKLYWISKREGDWWSWGIEHSEEDGYPAEACSMVQAEGCIEAHRRAVVEASPEIANLRDRLAVAERKAAALDRMTYKGEPPEGYTFVSYGNRDDWFEGKGCRYGLAGVVYGDPPDEDLPLLRVAALARREAILTEEIADLRAELRAWRDWARAQIEDPDEQCDDGTLRATIYARFIEYDIPAERERVHAEIADLRAQVAEARRMFCTAAAGHDKTSPLAIAQRLGWAYLYPTKKDDQ